VFLPYRRATLLIPSGPDDDPDRKHLFIIITDPVDNPGEVLLVSMSTIRDDFPYDDSCILSPGDHPFVKHESYIDYGKARILTAVSLMRGEADGSLIHKGAIDEEVIVKICDGLMTSRRTSPKVQKFYQNHSG